MKYCKIVEINKRTCRFVFLLIALLPALPASSQVTDSAKVFLSTIRKEKYNKNTTLDLSLQDKIPGLSIIGKSGMPGEGAYLNIRGINTFNASGTPLLVLNGIPYLVNEDISHIINGYSRGLLSTFNVNDIKNVTLLKGTQTAQYGSLGANGVLLIETEQATSNNLDTRISFSGQYGISTPKSNIPTLGVNDYKNYLMDVGKTRYGNLGAMTTDYPFLDNSPNYYSYLFNNNADWSSIIQSPALVTDNVFRVEGGDAIAKYNLSFGYTSSGGVIESTKSERYNTLINANILVSRKIDIFTNVGLSYTTSRLQEQGQSASTNPLLAASLIMPMLSPYSKESDGNVLNRLAAYDEWNVNKNPTFPYQNVSNPLAIVNTLIAKDKIYDANIKAGLNYHLNMYLTITGLMNIGINYTEESNFIPGVTDKAIMPQYYGVGNNTVRKGVIQHRANYYGLNAVYERTFNKAHSIKANAGVSYLGRTLESDFSSGYNTSNDYYQALNYVTEDKKIAGDNIEWQWLNYFVNSNYTYKNLLKANVSMTLDGTSVSGVDAPRFGLFPSVGLTAMVNNLLSLPEQISALNLSVGVGRSGNSRFSSNYAKNYYQNSNMFNLGSIVRMNVPNTNLEWEKKDQLDLGLELSVFKNFMNLKADYFTSKAKDLLVARSISSVYGSSSYYDNTGAIETKGLELAIDFNFIRTKDFDFSLGASVASANSKIVSLGNSDELTVGFTEYGNDDATVIMRKGESPYQFYGYRTNGVYSSAADVPTKLKNMYGNSYQAGDVAFENVNNSDNVINAKDKVLLGSATPDFFGSFNAMFRFKNISLNTVWGYSYGNEAYNAVRRELESMSTFYNQSKSVLNRWQIEGQSAALPRAEYGDPTGNNVFSDRWIEDASYLKLRNITLQYSFGNLLNICQSGNVYISGDNLLTFTKYLRSDPEFSYSNSAIMQGFDYAKVARPKTIKVGFQLYF